MEIKKEQLVETLKMVKFTRKNLNINKLVLVFNRETEQFRLAEIPQTCDLVTNKNELEVAEFYNTIRLTKNHEEKINYLAEQYLAMIQENLKYE